VAAYLKDHGYRIIPVRPAQDEILGEKAYPSLDDLPGTVDIVDVFRSAEQILPHAREALRLRPLAFWMQEGIANPEAAGLLTAAGIDVVMDRCIKRDHERLFGNVPL
jgi:predicted CoA-binding protein